MSFNPNQIDDVFVAQRKFVKNEIPSTLKQRRHQLRKLLKSIKRNEKSITSALHNDLRKHEVEAKATEILIVVSELKLALSHLERWMRNKPVPTPITLFGGRSYVQPQPKGNVLIIAPWNYPFSLVMGPLVSAIAAGNRVIIKPSEFVPNTNAVIKTILSETFNQTEVAFFEGEAETAQHLLSKPFNHIFFTGSPTVGKIVMQAAAKYLSFITLELGGKSPVIIDETANMKSAVERVTWGKCTNAGQICIAPDYVLIHESKLETFQDLFFKQIKSFYGNIEESPDYPRIINERHFNRINQLIEETTTGKMLTSAELNADNKFIAPSLIINPALDSKIMTAEIFGPILPVITFSKMDEAIDIINQKENPLSLYIFSKSNSTIKKVLNRTSSGGVCINHTLVHFGNKNLPFGGSNYSGIGRGHGFEGFKTFSNMKSVFHQKLGFSTTSLLSAPFTKEKKRFIDFVIKWMS